MSTLLPFVKEGYPELIYVSTSGSDCFALEEQIRVTADEECERCTIEIALCE